MLGGGSHNLTRLDQPAVLMLLQTVTTVLWGDERLILNAARHSAFKQNVGVLKELSRDEATKNAARSLEAMLN